LGKSTKTIGIVWSLGRPSAEGMVRELAMRMWRRGYVTFMADGLSDPGASREILADLGRRGVDGVVLQASHGLLDDAEIVRRLEGFGAAVAVTDEMRDSPVDLVIQDMPHAIGQTMDYFWATGRRRIGFAGSVHSNQEKIGPMRAKLRAWGLSDRDVTIDTGEAGRALNHYDHYVAALERHFPAEGRKFPFDAVICASDDGAAATAGWLLRRGLSVPEDVGMVGVGNADLTRAADPPLASVERHYAELAEAVDETLFRRLERPEEAVRLKVVPSTFVWRESAGRRYE
jgi:DNA-binding LacI/PurR family transcriptional regulator